MSKADKLAIITGADGGMGREITLSVAKAGYSVIMACINKELASDCCNAIRKESGNSNVEIEELNLASLQSIREFAKRITDKGKQVELLANNAGVLCWKKEYTAEGFEKSIGINYIGHYLLTKLLLPLMSEGSRVVSTVSCTYKIGKIQKEPFYRKNDTFWRIPFYSDSKLALTLFTLKLSELVKDRGICVNASDPGIVSTGIIRQGNIVIDKLADWFFRPFIYKPKRGASTAVKLLLDETLSKETGAVYSNCKHRHIPNRVLNHPKKDWLWNETAKIVGLA